MPVQNMLLYPSQEYANYDRPQSAVGGGNSIQQNAALMLGNLAGGGGGGSGAVGGNNAAEPSYPFFSLRPLIDSIFEIPISTLRAVNNLVGRLTGSYRQAPAPDEMQKSVAIEADAPLRLPAAHPVAVPGNFGLSAATATTTTTTGTAKRQQMREELA
ncbi:uncharacterized protein LOC135432033 isoform X5 [Drosophila montana]